MSNPEAVSDSARPQRDDTPEVNHTRSARADELEARCHALEDSLREKDAALREMQHRAKNSLQLVLSLLRLQHHRIADPALRAAYDMTMQRVEVLAVLYRQMHETRSETLVDLSRYTQDLCDAARHHLEDDCDGVTMLVEAAPLTTSLYTAMPLGLIINELVTQGLRYAYPEAGRLLVRLERLPSGKALLTVASNGRALPSGFDSETDAGSMLVEALATQLNADLDISQGSGTKTRLTLTL